MALHPFIAAMLKQLEGRPALSGGTPADARALIKASSAALGAGPEMVDVSDITIPGRGGPIRARLYKPTAAPHGVIAYLHGGGWVIGSIEDFDTFARQLAQESGCAVVMPDYRLAPEHPFPAGLEDCEDVLVWLAQNPAHLLGRSAPIVIAGDSAGGNLATVVARRLRGKVAIAAQILIYPVADCDFSTASYGSHATGLPLTKADMIWFFQRYAPDALWSSPDIAALRATELTGMPPALVVTAEYDVLADEGLAYAARLRAYGVPVTERHVMGVPHGFIRLGNLFDVARDEVKVIADFAASACKAGA